MKHQCQVCLREFTDDGEPLPEFDRVHCVFCGAPIPLERGAVAGNPVPFSNEAVRIDGAALGVISGERSFPETLPQFRVPGAAKSNGDSLMPTSDGGLIESRSPAPPLRRRSSFWVSLGVGFAFGALLAREAASLRAPNERATAAQKSSATVAVLPSPPAVPPSSVPQPAPSPVSSAAIPSASAKVAPRVDAAGERRFWLETARGAQRRYHVEEAERSYRRVLSRWPGDCEAIAGLGELELLRGNAERATERFHEALGVNGDYIPAQLAVADLEWQAGRADAARARYREIVEKYSSDLYPPYVAQRSESEPPQCDK